MDSDMMDAAGLQGRSIGSPDGDARHHHHPPNLHHYHLNQQIGRYDLPQHLLPNDQHIPSMSSPPFASLNRPGRSLSYNRHDLASVNPDDFYTSYSARHSDSEPLDNPPMASSSSSRLSGRPSGESQVNGHAGNPKQTERPPNRTLPRASNLRSVSSPVVPKSGATRSKQPSGKASVKDLKKRFDQGDTTSSSIPHVPQQTGNATRSRKEGVSASRSKQAGQSYATLRSGAMQSSTPTASSRPQRSKFVSEDQISQNVKSFATRVGKPRTLTATSANSSTLTGNMSHLSPNSSPPSSPSAASLMISQGLLFGEILPDQYDTSALGFGIEAVRPREVPEVDSHNRWAHQRSLSDPDIAPSPPNDWYHAAVPQHTDANPGSTHSHPSPRDRSSSFSGNAKEKTSQRVNRKPISRNPASSHNVSSTASKLPLSVRKLNSPNGSSSTSSTRSNSPSRTKRPHANGRTSRATTPTTNSKTTISRAKTPTQPGSGRKGAPPGLLTPNSNTRLQAYITTPPPKLSPPLRSSRPRQPVSSATTTSSRLRAVERSNGKNSTLLESRQIESSTRPRKISVGPIDFEQRREHIRLAYTKSLRESQALEVRQKAAEKRRKEMEAAAKAKVVAEAAAVNATIEPAEQTLEPRVYEGAPPKITDQDDGWTISNAESPSDLHVVIREDPTEAVLVSSSPIENEQPTPDLTTPIAEISMNSFGSPDLGVPGSFPALSPLMDDEDEVPLSAVTTTSETTEFDIEPQPEIPDQSESSVLVPITTIKPSGPPSVSQQSEYQYPFAEEDLSPVEQPALASERAPKPEFAVVEEKLTPQLIPGAFADADEDYHGRESPRETVHEMPIMILPSEDDVASPPITSTNMVLFPRLELQDESDCHTDLEDVPQVSSHHDPGEPIADACSEDSDDHNRTDDCQSESRFGDQPSSHVASSCASSDAGDGYDIHHQQHDQNLRVPIMRAKRESQQSAWTDLSVESSGPSNVTVSPDLNGDHQEPGSPAFGHVTIFGSQVLSRDSDTASKETYDVQASPQPPYSSAGSSAFLEQYQFTDLNGGDDSSIPYLSQGQSVSLPYVPIPPDHDPPPIPTAMSTSDLDSRRVSSAFYEQSQYDSTLVHSDRGSEEFLSQLETPQTDNNSISASEQWPGAVSQTSIEAKAVAPDGEELSDKERHRLVQRRNVIKELIDTEAVFVRDMNIVEEIYKGTAEACPKLEDKTVKQVFRNTDEIIEFHTSFLAQLKEDVASVYVPKGGRSFFSKEDPRKPELSRSNTVVINDAKDRITAIGPAFKDNIERMKAVHETFLRSSDQAARKLIQIQQDPTVKVWLNECNEVAKELTAAWDLDSLLIKPMQRITKYPNLILTLLQHTPADHPDREILLSAKETLETAIIEINQTKKNFELVGQIVGRQRKGSDVKTGFARAFGKRVDKLQPTGTRPPEDPVYTKLNEKFGDDYLRLQVVLRDVEFYTRQATSYVREFLNYLSSIELIMRLQPGGFPEIESKWVQFNISIRDLEKVTLDDHLAQVRKLVIEPFEQVIKAYGNPSLAMKKRQKRRLDFERMEQLKRSGKTGDARLIEQVEQYEALNDTLKIELPKLSALTERMGNICLGNFVNIQAKWYGIWKEKMRTVLADCPDTPEIQDIVESFERDFPYVREQVASIGIVQPTPKGRASQSTGASSDDAASKIRSPRPSDVDTFRSRQLSVNDDAAPYLPTPDFLKRNSGSLSISPTGVKPNLPSPQQYYKDYYAGLTNQTSNSTSTGTLDMTAASIRSPIGTGAASTRPSTGRSFDSGGIHRPSVDSNYRRDSNTTYSSTYQLPQDHRRFSGLFHSALPLPDGPEDSHRSSRASSQERVQQHDSYNILWLAASLFEFNIATTKHEAGYPYLIYQAGEIFDVIAEKGELWLAKNQDDPREQVGWIWSKHFAKLADS